MSQKVQLQSIERRTDGAAVCKKRPQAWQWRTTSGYSTQMTSSLKNRREEGEAKEERANSHTTLTDGTFYINHSQRSSNISNSIQNSCYNKQQHSTLTDPYSFLHLHSEFIKRLFQTQRQWRKSTTASFYEIVRSGVPTWDNDRKLAYYSWNAAAHNQAM